MPTTISVACVQARRCLLLAPLLLCLLRLGSAELLYVSDSPGPAVGQTPFPCNQQAGIAVPGVSAGTTALLLNVAISFTVTPGPPLTVRVQLGTPPYSDVITLTVRLPCVPDHPRGELPDSSSNFFP